MSTIAFSIDKELEQRFRLASFLGGYENVEDFFLQACLEMASKTFSDPNLSGYFSFNKKHRKKKDYFNKSEINYIKRHVENQSQRINMEF